MDWFARRLLTWYDHHGRHDLPWQHPASPYRVWVSEVMLQQTQVGTVIPYFDRFMAAFPDVQALAAAPLDRVLELWTGLGYYARARNLHRAAERVVAEHGGELPCGVEALTALPGIGRSTAGAIASISQGLRAPILDGNVKRVLARFHAVEGPVSATATQQALWSHADEHTPQQRVADYTQAIMDLGATLCRRRAPDCDACPVAARCAAAREGTQDQYPQRAPRRHKPSRSAAFWLVVDEAGRCLLERRPPEGLWGGLWTPPERPLDHGEATLLDELGLPAAAVAERFEAPPFRHSFTHYHLDITPRTLRLDRSPAMVADEDRYRWVDPAAPALGLAAPAVRLLGALQPFELD